MRTAACTALVLTGTAILMAAMATSGASAGSRPIEKETLRAVARDMAADLPRPQPAPRPEMLPGYAHAEIFAALSNIARFLEFPELPVHIDNGKNRSIWSALDRDALDRQSRDISSRRRGVLPHSLADTRRGCASGGNPENAGQTQEVADDEEKTLHARQHRPAPVVLRFEAVININVAGLGW